MQPYRHCEPLYRCDSPIRCPSCPSDVQKMLSVLRLESPYSRCRQPDQGFSQRVIGLAAQEQPRPQLQAQKPERRIPVRLHHLYSSASRVRAPSEEVAYGAIM